MDDFSFQFAFLVFEFGLRLICVDYDIVMYEPCDVVPCAQSRGDISIVAEYNEEGRCWLSS